MGFAVLAALAPPGPPINVISARVVTPWRGVGFVDLDLDPLLAPLAPTSGKAVLTIGSPPGPITIINGTIDKNAAGVFVSTAKLRLVFGGNGWDSVVPAQHFHSDAFVLSTLVYSTTGAIVGEVVTDVIPQPLGTDFVRSNGPASRVLADRDWYVDPTTGITFVGPRVPAIPDLSLEILDFDPLEQRATLSCDALIAPFTPLVDLRIPSSPVFIRDVEQTFTAQGSRAIAYCSSNAAAQMQSALISMVREFAKTDFLKVYRYRFVLEAGSSTKLALQRVKRDPLTALGDPVPDLLPATVFTGMSGVTADLFPSLEVLVTFVDGDPTQPQIVGFSTLLLPLKLSLDAVTELDVGTTALITRLAGGAQPVARVGDTVTVVVPGVQTGSGTATGAGTITGPGNPRVLA